MSIAMGVYFIADCSWIIFFSIIPQSLKSWIHAHTRTHGRTCTLEYNLEMIDL